MKKMTLTQELTWRGFVNQTTYKDLSILDGKPITFYFGVDPSSDSMTVGNLATAIMVKHFIDAGHRAILLVGGATGMIGDPDGKSSERDLKTFDEIAKNKAGIASQYKTVFAGQNFELVEKDDEGLERGLTEGLERGRQERDIEMARTLLSREVDIEIIAEATALSKEEIDSLMGSFNQDRSGRLAQKTLAYEVTKLVHGKDRADSVKRISEVLFGGLGYSELKASDFKELTKEIGLVNSKPSANVIDLIVETKLASSKSDARRFVQSGAIYINGKPIDVSKTKLENTDFIDGYLVLRRGKNAQTVIKNL